MRPGGPAAPFLHGSCISSKSQAGTCPMVSLKADSAPLKIQGTLHKAAVSGANRLGFLQFAPGLGFSGVSLAHAVRPMEEKAHLFPAEQQTHGCAVPRQKLVLSVHPRDEKLSGHDLLCFALPPSLPLPSSPYRSLPHTQLMA